MIVQIYLTIFLIFALVAGVLVALFGRPFLRRWNEETRQEEYRKQCAMQEKAQREAAQKEVAMWCAEEAPVTTAGVVPENAKPSKPTVSPAETNPARESEPHVEENRTR